MIRLRTALLAALVACWAVTPLQAQAQEPIRCARTPDISPDGKLVAFSYLGDIWIVEAIGGVARPVTMHEKHDLYPVFSPDGRKLAFSSNRNGSYDVFVVPIQGGRPTRLTFDSADDLVCGWSPDGKSILFASPRGTVFPPVSDLYTIPATGGRVTRVTTHEGRDGVFSPDGKRIAYVRGPGSPFRKGYRGSSNNDVWLADLDGGNNVRVTTFNGVDASPIYSPDGRFLYYVSDCWSDPGGPANLVRMELTPEAIRSVAAGSRPQQVTTHKDMSVRRARLSASGEWIVYECGPDLWITSTRNGSSPRKLAIEVHADDRTNPQRTVTFKDSGVTEFTVSPDDRYLAFVVHGEIFLIPRGGGKAKRLTSSPAHDHGVAWSPDGKQLIFLSDRGGQEDVYLLQPDDPEHPELVKAHQFKFKQLTNTPEAEIGINFSPNGKRISFLRAGKLVTMNADGTDVRVVVNEGMVIDYEWSPDSKWIVYSRMDGSWASELYIIPSTGATAADPARNVTRYATFNAGVTWSRSGNKLAFLSERRSNTSQSLFVLSLQRPAVPGTPASKDFDWDDIHRRVVQPAPIPVRECAISRDGTKVAFRGLQNGDDLWLADTDGKGLVRLTNGNMKPNQIQWSRGVMSTLLYFRDGKGSIRMTSVATPGAPPLVPFEAKMTVHRDQDFAQLFEQSWRLLYENFYDSQFHGVDWKAVRERYRPLVRHIAMKEDLHALISMMLGELNASHLGLLTARPAPEQQTADLGLLYDDRYRGPGVKVAEIVKGGPADRRGLNLKPSDVIESIDRVQLTDRVELAQALNEKAGEVVVVEVTSKPGDPKARRRIEMMAVNRTQLQPFLYRRWVDANAQKVAELSKGKLGYIHIPSMDEDGLDAFLRAMYSDNTDKEAIVLDVRFNSGGFTHDRVLNYLGGKEHTYFLQRNGGVGPVLRSTDRRWNKPLVLLVNNRSYSDAEIFPHAFRTLGLGKLVGQPTGGHVIGTGRVQLIDGSSFMVPRTGVFTFKGVNMEKEGVSPDYGVECHPDELARGIDRQLEKAVEVLQHEVTLWKKSRPGVVFNPPGGAPGPSPMVNPAPPMPGPMTPPGPKSGE
ncbi:MAG: S41 family peptidase [Gemmataceae bacterium]|nr:S41 family peptidase [Gemmataceae bacterium]